MKRNILLVAITRLGDMLQMSPTILGLRKQNPGCKITVLIEKQFASICDGIPGIDNVEILDLGFVTRALAREQQGIIDAYSYVHEMIERLQEERFDYCLNLSNSSYTALFIKMLGVEDTRGWLSDDQGHRIMADPWAMLFASIVYHSNRRYNSFNLVDMFRMSAGVGPHVQSLAYTVTDEGRVSIDEFLSEEGIESGGPLLCIQAGASQGKRQWAPARFAHLSRLLVEKLDARIVYTGAGAESVIIDRIQALYSHPNCVSAVGKTNFSQLSALLERAELLITGDTGPMHLSVAVGTPVVTLFLASALCFETGPYSEGNIILQPQISCSPCNPNYPCSRPDCHEQITPELVTSLVEVRLATPRGKEHLLTVSNELAPPSEVIVYLSKFDEDGFLNCIPLNGIEHRGGERRGYFHFARMANRRLWKEELAGVEPLDLSSHVTSRQSVLGVEELLTLAEQGLGLCDDLIKAIRDSSVPAEILTQIEQALTETDRKIEEVGFSASAVSILVRMLVMEKENLRGDDPLYLVQKTAERFNNLLRRSKRFAALFDYYCRNESSRALPVSAVPTMRNEIHA